MIFLETSVFSKISQKKKSKKTKKRNMLFFYFEVQLAFLRVQIQGILNGLQSYYRIQGCGFYDYLLLF